MAEGVYTHHFLSRREAAEFLGVCVRLFDRWVAERKIPAIRASRRVLLDLQDLERFYQARKEPAAA